VSFGPRRRAVDERKAGRARRNHRDRGSEELSPLARVQRSVEEEA
jgi:hypothetical protein